MKITQLDRVQVCETLRKQITIYKNRFKHVFLLTYALPF